MAAERQHYMLTVDEKSSLRLWDINRQVMLEEEAKISKGLMATVCIDPIEGRFFACGGIDGKIHVYQFTATPNLSKKSLKDQTVKLIGKSYEFSGH